MAVPLCVHCKHFKTDHKQRQTIECTSKDIPKDVIWGRPITTNPQVLRGNFKIEDQQSCGLPGILFEEMK